MDKELARLKELVTRSIKIALSPVGQIETVELLEKIRKQCTIVKKTTARTLKANQREFQNILQTLRDNAKSMEVLLLAPHKGRWHNMYHASLIQRYTPKDIAQFMQNNVAQLEARAK